MQERRDKEKGKEQKRKGVIKLNICQFMEDKINDFMMKYPKSQISEQFLLFGKQGNIPLEKSIISKIHELISPKASAKGNITEIGNEEEEKKIQKPITNNEDLTNILFPAEELRELLSIIILLFVHKCTFPLRSVIMLIFNEYQSELTNILINHQYVQNYIFQGDAGYSCIDELDHILYKYFELLKLCAILDQLTFVSKIYILESLTKHLVEAINKIEKQLINKQIIYMYIIYIYIYRMSQILKLIVTLNGLPLFDLRIGTKEEEKEIERIMKRLIYICEECFLCINIEKDILLLASLTYWDVTHKYLSQDISKNPTHTLSKFITQIFSRMGKVAIPTENSKLEVKQEIWVVAAIRGLIRLLDTQLLQLAKQGAILYDGKELGWIQYCIKCANSSNIPLRAFSIQAIENYLHRIYLLKLSDQVSISQIKEYINLAIDNLDYHTKSVVGIAEGCLKTIINICTQRDELDSLKSTDCHNICFQIVDSIPASQAKKKMQAINQIIVGLRDEDIQHVFDKYFDYALYLVTNKKASRTALSFLNIILQKLLTIHKNTLNWGDIWVDKYIKYLSQQEKDELLTTSESFVRLIMSIHSAILPRLLFKYLEEIYELNGGLASLVSILKEGRAKKECSLTKEMNILFPKTGETINLGREWFKNTCISHDPYRSLSILEFINSTPKICEMVEDTELEIILYILEFTSPQTSDDFCEKLSKLLQIFFVRFRTSVEPLLVIYEALNNGEESGNLLLQKKTNKEEVMGQIGQLKEQLTQIRDLIYKYLRFDRSYETVQIFYDLFINTAYYFSDRDPPMLKYLKSSAKYSLDQEVGFFRTDKLYTFVGCLGCSWEKIRLNSYEIVNYYPDNLLLEQQEYLRDLYLDWISDPKAFLSHGAVLILKIFYTRFLPLPGFQFDWNKVSILYSNPGEVDKLTLIEDKCSCPIEERQLHWAENIIEIIKYKLKGLIPNLFERATDRSLIHGELAFLSILVKELEVKEHLVEEWRRVVKDLLQLIFEISDLTESLLSTTHSIKLSDGHIIMDCRGHLLKQIKLDLPSPHILPHDKKDQSIKSDIPLPQSSDSYTGDYENLISTGIWLIAKENGTLCQELLKWVNIPSEVKVKKFRIGLDVDEIINLGNILLGKILGYKHRGVFEGIAKILESLLKRATESQESRLSNLASDLLERVFDVIKIENVSKTLRRSAGLPPAILCILHSESLPILLEKTMYKLFEMMGSAERDDQKIHILNIIKLIVEDATLSTDLHKFLDRGLFLATEAFLSENWGVRNSGLMAFTSLTKRIFGSSSTQKDILNYKSITIIDFFLPHFSLCQFFAQKLSLLTKEEITSPNDDVEINEQTKEFALYPILLLISRLNYGAELEQAKKQMNLNKSVLSQREKIADKILEYQEYITRVLGHKSIYLREMAAKSLIVFISPDQLIDTAVVEAQKLKDWKEGANKGHGILLYLRFIIEAFISNINNENYEKSVLEKGNNLNILTLFQCLTEILQMLNSTSTNYTGIEIAELMKIMQLLEENTYMRPLTDSLIKEIFIYCKSEAERILAKSAAKRTDWGADLEEQYIIKFICKHEGSITQSSTLILHIINSPLPTDLRSSLFKSLSKLLKEGDLMDTEALISIADLLMNTLLEEQDLEIVRHSIKLLECLFMKRIRNKLPHKYLYSQLATKLPSIILNMWEEFRTPQIQEHLLLLSAQVIKLLGLHPEELKSFNLRSFSALFCKFGSWVLECLTREEKETMRISGGLGICRICPLLNLGNFNRLLCVLLMMFEGSSEGKLTQGVGIQIDAYISLWESLILCLNSEIPQLRGFASKQLSKILKLPDFSLSLLAPDATLIAHKQIHLDGYTDSYITFLLSTHLLSLFSASSIQIFPQNIQLIVLNGILKLALNMLKKWYYKENEELNAQKRIFLYEPSNRYFNNIDLKLQAKDLFFGVLEQFLANPNFDPKGLMEMINNELFKDIDMKKIFIELEIYGDSKKLMSIYSYEKLVMNAIRMNIYIKASHLTSSLNWNYVKIIQELKKGYKELDKTIYEVLADSIIFIESP